VSSPQTCSGSCTWISSLTQKGRWESAENSQHFEIICAASKEDESNRRCYFPNIVHKHANVQCLCYFWTCAEGHNTAATLLVQMTTFVHRLTVFITVRCRRLAEGVVTLRMATSFVSETWFQYHLTLFEHHTKGKAHPQHDTPSAEHPLYRKSAGPWSTSDPTTCCSFSVCNSW